MRAELAADETMRLLLEDSVSPRCSVLVVINGEIVSHFGNCASALHFLAVIEAQRKGN